MFGKPMMVLGDKKKKTASGSSMKPSLRELSYLERTMSPAVPGCVATSRGLKTSAPRMFVITHAYAPLLAN